MPELNKDDIVITLVAQIKKSGAESKVANREFVILFGKTETDHGLSEGSVAPNIEEAATEAGFEVLHKGSDRASLRMIPHSGKNAFV